MYIGGYAYDSIGFEAGTLIEVGALGSTVIVMLILFFSAAIYTNSTHQVKVRVAVRYFSWESSFNINMNACYGKM